MGEELPAGDRERPPPLPTAGTPPLILDYGGRTDRRRSLPQISPIQWAVTVGVLTFLFSIGTGRTPALVAVASGLLGSVLVFVYARARARRPTPESSLLTMQLLAAGGMAMSGVIAMIDRARLVSNSLLWLPDNQTHPFRPAWALQPLWLTAIGIVWFVAAAMLVEWRDRDRSAQSRESA